jgi:hypothetical protein
LFNLDPETLIETQIIDEDIYERKRERECSDQTMSSRDTTYSTYVSNKTKLKKTMKKVKTMDMTPT